MIRGSRHSDSSTAPPEDAYVLPFKEFLAVLWRQAWIIVLVTFVFAGTAVGIDLTRQPLYETSITILVGQERGITETPTDVSGLQDLTVTMATAVPSRPLAQTVIERAGLQITPEAFLEKRLSASPIEETQFIEVTYRDPDPQKAQQVANIVGDVFSERVSKVSSSANAITATVWEPAALPSKPVSPNPLRDGVLAAVLGAVLGAGLALLLGILNDRWRSPEELEEVSGVPVFGIIPQFEVRKSVKKGKG
jgi:capsular polysaccharide biosynthesis protein